MSQNLFCAGQKTPGYQYEDGYYRTFKTPPPIGGEVRDMLNGYVESEEYTKVQLFFMHYCKLDYDYSLYLTRELIEGNYG